MTDEKWEKIIFLVEERCKVTARKKEEFEVAQTAVGEPIFGQCEYIEFEGPLGKMKMERVIKPKIVDKKVLHTKRIGGKVAVDYIYSEEEKTYQFKIYKWDDKNNLWQEVDLKDFNF